MPGKNPFSACAFAGKTQMEVADEIGISQAQVSRLEKAALKTLGSTFAKMPRTKALRGFFVLNLHRKT